MPTLPPILRYPRPGFWAFHLLVVPTVLGGGFALGVSHATGHPEAPSDAHAAHHAPPAHAPAEPAEPAAHDAHAAHGAATPTGPAGTLADNPIRAEMITLQAAYDTLNRGVILGDARGVAEAFHQVHARKEATAAALATGTARPPKNADRIEAFVARDEALHALLETTAEAAGKDDLATLRRMTTELRDGCIGCHEEFRGER